VAPGFLVAVPQLQDPNFEQTVILLLEHSREGTLGLVLNRESRLTFGELARAQELPVSAGHEGERVHVGGPVEPFRGFILHDAPETPESQEILPGLFLTVANTAVKPLLLNQKARLLFCLGCSGWGPGQLEKELNAGSWLVTEASAEFVLTEEPARMWQSILAQMGIDPHRLIPSGGVN
jgi:putative transcriptional regulator